MINNEVELTRTVNLEAKDRLVSMLVKAGVSYLEKWERVPLLKRREYHGAKEICVIFINDNQGEQAREVLERFRALSGENGERKEKLRRKKSRRAESGDLTEPVPGKTRKSGLSPDGKPGKAGIRLGRAHEAGGRSDRYTEDDLGSIGTLKTRSGDKSARTVGENRISDRSSVAGILNRNGGRTGRYEDPDGDSREAGRFKKVKFRDSGEEVLQEEVRKEKGRRGPDPFLDTSDLDAEL